MQQEQLWYETIWDASKALVDYMGGPKKVGHSLRPELDPHDAGEWLRNCLNPKKRDKLDIDQFLLLLNMGRDAGCHVAMHHLSEAAGYEKPRTIDPESERDRLQRKFISATEELTALAKRIERFSSETS